MYGPPIVRLRTALELRAQRELHVALTVLACNLTKCRAGRVEVRRAPVRVVEDVEGLCAELQLDSFIDGNRLEQAHVPVLQTRVVDQVANPLLCVERPSRRLREH